MTIRKTTKIGEVRNGSAKARPARSPASLPTAQGLDPPTAAEDRQGMGLPADGRSAEPARAQGRSPSRGPRHVATDQVSPRYDQRRLAELKIKLGDEDYMNGAILRIATVLSARLTLR